MYGDVSPRCAFGCGDRGGAVIRIAAALVILACLTAAAVLVDTHAGTAIVFSFIGHTALAGGIGVYVWDRLRPVQLTDDEQALYQLAFTDLSPRSFLEFATLGQWRDAEAGERLLQSGKEIGEILILRSGSVRFEVKGEALGTLGPGQLVGAAIYLSGNPSWGDAIVEEPGRYLSIPVRNVADSLAKKPETRAILNGIVSRDLAEKLRLVTDSGAAT